jgi:hypothetical protein
MPKYCMKTFVQYLKLKEDLEDGVEGGAYHNMLDRLETMVGSVQPYGFNKEADDEAYRARKDVLNAIIKLRMAASQNINIQRTRVA